jgi:hypothetical protein
MFKVSLNLLILKILLIILLLITKSTDVPPPPAVYLSLRNCATRARHPAPSRTPVPKRKNIGFYRTTTDASREDNTQEFLPLLIITK